MKYGRGSPSLSAGAGGYSDPYGGGGSETVHSDACELLVKYRSLVAYSNASRFVNLNVHVYCAIQISLFLDIIKLQNRLIKEVFKCQFKIFLT